VKKNFNASLLPALISGSVIHYGISDSRDKFMDITSNCSSGKLEMLMAGCQHYHNRVVCQGVFMVPRAMKMDQTLTINRIDGVEPFLTG
jgi:hypothetical protein